MNATIKLSYCPRCHKPLAAVTPGESRAAAWLPIADQVIDLAAEPLTWCPDCKSPLPVAPVVRAGYMLTEVQS